jgi:hypothetical protein
MNWSEIPWRPAPRTLRQFAVLWLLAFLIASVQALRAGSPTVAITLAILAIGVGGPGLVAPPTIRVVFVGSMVLTFPIGWVVSRIALAAIFYGIFTPIGLLMRLCGRDVLELQRPERDSYWSPKPQPADVRAYFRES